MRTSLYFALLLSLASGCSNSKESAFDLAYPSQWTFSVEGPVSGYLLVVNTGIGPLQLDTLHVDAVTDDHPQATVQIDTKPFTARKLEPGEAGGQLSLLSKSLLVDSGLVAEPLVDTSSDYLSIGLVDAPEGTYDVHATAKLSIAHQQVTLPFTIHVVPGPTVYADPAGGSRVSFKR